MKKIIFLGCFIFFITVTGLSQLYFRFGGGIGIGFPWHDPSFTNSTGQIWSGQTEPSNPDVTDVNSTLGTGVNANIALSWMINKYIGTEIAINEFYGASVYKKDFYTWGNGTSGYGWRSYEETRWGMMLQFIPSVIITPGLNKVNPYARLGLIIGAIPKVYQKSLSYESVGYTYSTDNYYYGGISLGFASAAGADFRLTRIITFFSEIDFNYARYSPKYGFYDDSNPNYPDVQVKTDLINSKVSFSNFQINLGVKFFLGN